MGTQRRGRRGGTPYSFRVLFGLVCALALVLGPLSLLGPPAQAATGAGTWSLDAGPAQLGFGEVDAISCADPTYCVALSSNQYEDDALIFSNGSWSTAPLVEPGGALQLNSVSCFSESFCMAVGQSSGSGVHPNALGVIEEWMARRGQSCQTHSHRGSTSGSAACRVPARQVASLSDGTTPMAGSSTAGTACLGRRPSMNQA